MPDSAWAVVGLSVVVRCKPRPSTRTRHRIPAPFSAVYRLLDLLPSHLDLFTVDLDLGGQTRRESILERKLKATINDYDLIVCDCPPNLTLPTQNALSFSSFYIIPVSLDYLSGVGIGLLIQRVERFGVEVDNALTNAGIVISRVGRPARHREETEVQFVSNLVTSFSILF